MKNNSIKRSILNKLNKHEETSTRLKGFEKLLNKLTPAERMLINCEDLYQELLTADNHTKQLADKLDKKGVRVDYGEEDEQSYSSNR